MGIPVTREDTNALKQWGLGLEKIQEACGFCRMETPFWHLATNHPVCESCAGKHETTDLPVRAPVRAAPASPSEATP